jgi:glycerol-3-phosphate dehydrogenase
LGADACNYVEATDFLMKRNQIVGVSARDIIADKNFEIRSKVVVNSTGPWVDRILESLDRVPGPPVFQPSLAVNMITRQLVDDYAAGVPSWLGESNSGGSNQPASHMLFVSPWRGNSIIGTFHSHFQGDPDNFSLQEQDLQEFIDEANSAYPGANLDLDDIKFVHFGFLPEVPNPKRTEVKLVRKSRIIDHLSDDGLSGLISVMGVKYTTARHTAENVVDMVFKKLGKRPTSGGSQNSRVYGGQIDKFGDFLASTVQKDSTNMTPETIDHWVRSYGTQYSTVKEQLTGTDERAPYSLLSEPVIRAQVIYAVQEEMAIKLADVIFRRTGIGTIGQPEDPILRFIANTMALELDWSPEKVNLEIDEVKAFYRRHGISNLVVENLEKA